MAYVLLITHSAALFPIGIFLWNWKNRKDVPSILMVIKFIFCVTFSLIYHSYNINDIPTVSEHEDLWTLLDGYASTSLIFTTTLYGLRVREPQFYVTANAFDTIILVIYLFDSVWFLTTWALVLSCSVIFIFKWKTVYRYLKKYYYICFFTLVFGVTAAINFAIAVQNQYNKQYILHHSLWHCFIFFTAGCGSLLRFKLDEELYPINRRNTLDSI
jgi:hypothetical protein